MEKLNAILPTWLLLLFVTVYLITGLYITIKSKDLKWYGYLLSRTYIFVYYFGAVFLDSTNVISSEVRHALFRIGLFCILFTDALGNIVTVMKFQKRAKAERIANE